jgi:hypothetical protein
LIACPYADRSTHFLTCRIAWFGGNLKSNKDEALYMFLLRKKKQGEALTSEQMKLLDFLTKEKMGAHRATVQTSDGCK